MECTNEQLHYETLTIREAKNVVACLRKKVKEQDKIISSIQNAIEETKKFNKINRKK